MGADQQRLTPDERANLVAYLDDELNEAESRAIATKLTQSVSARREVDALAKTWELLDFLPRPKMSGDFTQRTLTEVGRLEVTGDRLAGLASRTLRHAGRTALWSLLAAALFVAGLVATRWIWPDPTARLARDLSIAESYDDYRAIGSIEFLEGLDRSPDFNNSPE